MQQHHVPMHFALKGRKKKTTTLASRVYPREASTIVKHHTHAFNVCNNARKIRPQSSVRLLASHNINVPSTLLLAALDSTLLGACAGRAAEQVVETACMAERAGRARRWHQACGAGSVQHTWSTTHRRWSSNTRRRAGRRTTSERRSR